MYYTLCTYVCQCLYGFDRFRELIGTDDVDLYGAKVFALQPDRASRHALVLLLEAVDVTERQLKFLPFIKTIYLQMKWKAKLLDILPREA